MISKSREHKKQLSVERWNDQQIYDLRWCGEESHRSPSVLSGQQSAGGKLGGFTWCHVPSKHFRKEIKMQTKIKQISTESRNFKS
jgi:hypothetical protein